MPTYGTTHAIRLARLKSSSTRTRFSINTAPKLDATRSGLSALFSSLSIQKRLQPQHVRSSRVSSRRAQRILYSALAQWTPELHIGWPKRSLNPFARRSRVSVSTNVTPTPDNERLAYFHVIGIHRGLARHGGEYSPFLENLIALRVRFVELVCLWRSFIRLRREAIAGFKAVDFDQA